MTLEDTYRLLALLRQYRTSLRKLHGVRRRIVRLLDASPADTALRESLVDDLETRLDRCLDRERDALLAARERRHDAD